MKYVFILMSLVFSLRSHGQVDIVNRSLTDTTLNLLYIGVDNAMEIKGLKCYECKVTIIGGRGWIQWVGQNRYIARVDWVTDSCTFIVINKNGKKVLQKSFKTPAIPYAVITLAGGDTTISIKRILANPFLKIIFPGCHLRINNKIVSFNATFVHDTSSISTQNIGDVLSSEQIQLVKQLHPGDMIFFEAIYAVSPDSRRQHLPSFWIKIE